MNEYYRQVVYCYTDYPSHHTITTRGIFVNTITNFYMGLFKMTKYIVDCSWQMYGHVEIEAKDVDEAIHIAEQQTKLSDITADYVMGSFEVDYDTTRESCVDKAFKGDL